MNGLAGRREETGYRNDRFYKYFYIFAEPLFQYALSITKKFSRYQEDNGGVRETALPHDYV